MLKDQLKVWCFYCTFKRLPHLRDIEVHKHVLTKYHVLWNLKVVYLVISSRQKYLLVNIWKKEIDFNLINVFASNIKRNSSFYNHITDTDIICH